MIKIFNYFFSGEPSGSYNGRAYIRITRGTGIYGEVKVGWQLTPSSAGMTDFAQTSGEVTFGDGDQTTEIILQVKFTSKTKSQNEFCLGIRG